MNNNIEDLVEKLLPDARLFSQTITKLCNHLSKTYKEEEGLVGFLMLASAVAQRAKISEDSFLLMCRIIFRKTRCQFFM